MRDLLPRTLSHLEWLVAAPTENPPRRIRESAILDRLVHELGGSFSTTITDLGDGSLTLLARRGNPRILWNFHLDTVPRASSWAGSPFALRVDAERATGLGACDTKGAAAAMLSALEGATADVALLFTTDEEAGAGKCVEEFITRAMPFDAVVVAEPTEGEAVLAHRGIGTASGRFSGKAGHASSADAILGSATHEAVRWAARALELAASSRVPESRGLAGVRFNLGHIEGGLKPNVVAAEAAVRFGVRPPPGVDPRAVVTTFQELAPDATRVAWAPGFFGPAFPTDPTGSAAGRAETLATMLGARVGAPVDFWTEAALFSRAGYPALVLGPGSIKQAHTADEWVHLDQLRSIAATYERALHLR